MKAGILTQLMRMTEEEQKLSEGRAPLRRELYSRSSDFLIEKQRLSSNVYGAPDSPLLLRMHTRFTEFPPHSHDYIELMYVCQGTITHVIGDAEITLAAGDILMLGRSTVHAVRTAGLDDIGINMIISYDFYASLCNRMRSSTLLPDKIFTKLTATEGTPYCIFHTAKIGEIENLLENMISPFVSGREKNAAVLQAEFELLTAYLVSLPDIKSAVHGSDSRIEQSMRLLNRYIETTYRSATLVDAAEQLGLSPTYLCRWIRQHYNMTFKQLLTDKRFSVATELLLTTNLPINEIIEMVGYENSSYFHKEFRRRHGKTPKAIREEQHV